MPYPIPKAAMPDSCADDCLSADDACSAIVAPERTAALVAALKNALVRTLEREGQLTAAAEAKVHKCVDLVRLLEPHSALAEKLETLSCALRELHQLLLQGRVNAHASGLLRVKRAIEAL